MNRRFLATLATCAITSTGWALEYNRIITPLFGSGVTDAGWTTGTDGTDGGLQLALRARNLTANSTDNDLGVYSFSTGTLPGTLQALWSYEFSINVGQQSFSMYDFYLGIDVDAGAGVDYINTLLNPLLVEDNFYGGALNSLGSSPTIVQNTLNIGFDEIYDLDPTASGIYDYRLFAVAKPIEINNSPLPSSGGNPFIRDVLPTLSPAAPLADVNIQVIVSASTPVPDAGSTLAILGVSLAGLAGLRRRLVA